MNATWRLCAVVFAATIAAGSVQDAQQPAAQDASKATTDAQKPERGEQILNAACSTTCHDTRPIDTQALDEAGWTKAVKAMIEKGADVKPDDVPVLIGYLVKYHGPLPDGPGKDIVLNICTQCHDLQRVRRERLTPEGWAEILETMLNEGAPLTEQDFIAVLRYLARNFRPER
jgi:cytochrome c5